MSSFSADLPFEADRHHFGQRTTAAPRNVTAAEISFRLILPPMAPLEASAASCRYLRPTHAAAQRPAEPNPWVGRHPSRVS